MDCLKLEIGQYIISYENVKVVQNSERGVFLYHDSETVGCYNFSHMDSKDCTPETVDFGDKVTMYYKRFESGYKHVSVKEDSNLRYEGRKVLYCGEKYEIIKDSKGLFYLGKANEVEMVVVVVDKKEVVFYE